LGFTVNAKPSHALGLPFPDNMQRLRVSILLAAITLLAFALRAFHLDFQPLWNDEGYSIFFATRDFATMLEHTAVDIHPPFYYALLQLWMAFAGKSDVAARWLSVIIGVATIPLLYALASVVASGAEQHLHRTQVPVSPICD
jgi:predicted membrane-bound mannosyltransferase